MKIYDFTEPELQYFRTFCNFTPEEEELFTLRSRNISLEKCAEIMHRDSIKNLSARINNKIIRVVDSKRMNRWLNEVYWKSILENQ